MTEEAKIYEKLPKRVQVVIDRVRAGQKLCKSIRPMETGEADITFTFEPSGKRAGPRSAAQAIDCGLLAPSGDGLFGSETSQTWTAA